MHNQTKSIRPFIGAKDFQQSRSFYIELGFEEFIISKDLSNFKINDQMSFYLQNYYVQDWVNNLMVFLEVEDVDQYRHEIDQLNLDMKYTEYKLSPVKQQQWGKECFMHDPSGVLWIFGHFQKR